MSQKIFVVNMAVTGGSASKSLEDGCKELTNITTELENGWSVQDIKAVGEHYAIVVLTNTSESKRL